LQRRGILETSGAELLALGCVTHSLAILRPQRPTTAKAILRGEGRLHEPKFDCCRMQIDSAKCGACASEERGALQGRPVA
jgi:hypothetical protein